MAERAPKKLPDADDALLTVAMSVKGSSDDEDLADHPTTIILQITLE